MQQRRGTAAQWISTNGGAGPVLNAGEMGWESDTNKFKIGDGVNNWTSLDYFSDINSTVNPAFGSSITFEGATADSYETVLQVTDPTADRTITIPDVTGTVITTGNLSDITNIGVFTSTITMEGSTANDFELTLSAGDPTADRTITFPDATGTVALLSDIAVTASSTTTFTNKTLTSPVVSGLTLSDSGIVIEGSSADAHETTLTVTDPTADRTITFPDETGTVQLRVTDVSDTEIGYLNGVTSAIQTQLDAKLALAGGTMTGAIAMGTNKITGLGTPTADTDAATKAYVDAIQQGLHIHASVVAATTANITLATSVENGDVLDGVTLATGNRILVKNQSTASQNGIYVVASSGAPSRATDYDSPAEINGGDFVFVTGGTANDNKGFVQINTVGTVGTDAIEFAQFSGAGTFVAGNGLTLTDNSFTINTSITADLSTAQTLSNKDLTSGTNTFPTSLATLTGTQTLTNKTLTSPIVTGLTLNDSSIIIEGSTANAFETTLTVTDPTADRTITLPDATGTVALTNNKLDVFAATSSAELAGVISDETGSGALVFGTNSTITNLLANQPVLKAPEERWSVSATAATGTIALDTLTSGILYYTSNASANWTLNVRGDSGNTLNSVLATNDSITVVFFVTNGATPYYQTGFQIDGSSVTPKWQNGTAPSAGNANSIDIYSFTIVKTGSAAFTAFGSQTKFA